MWYISFFDLARSTYQWFQLRNGAGSCRDCSVSRRWCVPVQQQRCHQRRRLGTLLSCFGWGTPKKWIGKWRGLKFNMTKTQNGDTPSWVQHQIITIFRAQKMHGLIVTITNLVEELVPFFFDAHPAGILEDIYTLIKFGFTWAWSFFFESTSFVAKLPGRRWTSATWLGSICPVRTCIGKVSGRPPKICATLSGYMAVTHIASWMRIYDDIWHWKTTKHWMVWHKKHDQFGVVYWQHHTTPFLCHINVYKSLSVWTMLPCSPRMHESSEEDWPFRENAFIIDMWTVFTVCIGSFYTCII